MAASVDTPYFGTGYRRDPRFTFGFIELVVYGGAWAILLWHLARPLTMLKGITLGIILWVIMQLVVLPFLG